MPKETIRYKKEDITVVWKPNICTHSGICARGLRAVFNPSARPWINMDGAALEAIVAQVAKCPSGALSIETKNDNPL
jgi:uncharacterized Fe-S cluster protein YjdI